MLQDWTTFCGNKQAPIWHLKATAQGPVPGKCWPLDFCCSQLFFQCPAPYILCRPTLFLTDLCPTFQQEVRLLSKIPAWEDTWPTQKQLWEKHEPASEFSNSKISCDPQKKSNWLSRLYKKQIGNFSFEMEVVKSVKYYMQRDTGTNDPAPTDPFQWKFCSHIMLLWINSSGPKIPFAHKCCQKVKHTSNTYRLRS